MSNAEVVLRLLVQLTVILASCQLVGQVGRRIGQSQVVCEILAGILLGPSFFGLMWPQAQQALFPQTLVVGTSTITHPSMALLYALSHVALALYMFLVGLEFEPALLRGQGRQAAVISTSGILVPLALGALVGLLLAQDHNLFGIEVAPPVAALFMGVSISITAFPVLARILHQYHLIHSRLGSLVLTTAAVSDVTAWCLLAIVLATLDHTPSGAFIAIGGGALYALGMFTLGRWGLRLLTQRWERAGSVTPDQVVILLIFVLLGSLVTSMLGITEVFGAFVVGVVIPKGRFAETVQAQFGPLTTTLLLPLYFVYSGLNTRLGLVNTPGLWLITLLIIAVAMSGKGVASTLSARWAKLSWREGGTVGVLMNTRGLIELIVLNIGLEAGVISSTLFTMLVLMALITTAMTTPLYQWLYGRIAERERIERAAAPAGTLATASNEPPE